MRQIKIFKSVETEVGKLEDEVNAWLKQTNVQVVSITGNIAPQSGGPAKSSGLSASAFPPSDIVLIVLYETD